MYGNATQLYVQQVCFATQPSHAMTYTYDGRSSSIMQCRASQCSARHCNTTRCEQMLQRDAERCSVMSCIVLVPSHVAPCEFNATLLQPFLIQCHVIAASRDVFVMKGSSPDSANVLEFTMNRKHVNTLACLCSHGKQAIQTSTRFLAKSRCF